MIDVRKAAKESFEYLNENLDESLLFWQDHNRIDYLEKLNDKIQSGEIKGDNALIALGWIQAIAYTSGYTTKEIINKINKES